MLQVNRFMLLMVSQSIIIILPLKALALLMGLAILICTGPTWSREPSPFGEDQGALLILLDNSDSMLEEDNSPNRLARA